MSTQTIAIHIDRSWSSVRDFLAQPENFALWASGLAATLRQDGDLWIAEAPQGRVTLRFTEANDFGVADHWVTLPSGQEIHVPLRVIARGGGSEVMLTLFREPGVTDEAFAADAAWVERDLADLKQLLEA